MISYNNRSTTSQKEHSGQRMTPTTITFAPFLSIQFTLGVVWKLLENPNPYLPPKGRANVALRSESFATRPPSSSASIIKSEGVCFHIRLVVAPLLVIYTYLIGLTLALLSFPILTPNLFLHALSSNHFPRINNHN